MIKSNRPAQKNQPSRKGKKAWRKNIDIDEVEQGIDEIRDLERVVGISSLDKLGEAELFTVDTEGDEVLDKKALKQTKKLKADEILSRRSAIPALKAPKTKSKNHIEGVSKNEMHRLNRLAGRYANEKSSAMTAIDKEGITRGGGYDLWDEPQPAKKQKTTKNVKKDFTKDLNPALSHAKASVLPKTLGEAPIAVVHDSVAVAVPDAGRSYNPSIGAWKDLIRKEHAKEEERENQRLELLEKQYKIEEIMATVDDKGEIADSDEDDEDENQHKGVDARLSANKPVERKIKTQAQRNKEKRHKEKMELQEELKALKIQLRALEEVPKLLKAEEEKMAAEESRQKKVRKEGRRLGSKYRVMQAPLEVKLSDELSDCLRRLKPEGNLARDRFRSLQERGIIEARIAQPKRRKYTVKTTEKWQYKDIKL